MRIFAVLLFCISIVSNRDQHAVSPMASALASNFGGATKNILFKSTDGGKTWKDYSRGLPSDLQVSCVYAQGKEVFLGTQDGGLYSSSNPEGGIWEQQAIGWALPNFDGTMRNASITGVFPGHTGPYASVYGAGLYHRIQGTNRWQPMETLKESNVYTVIETPDESIFVGCFNGIFKSEDDGKTWKHVFDEGQVQSLATINGILIASGPQGLLRSTDGGNYWDCVLADQGGIYNTNVVEGRFAAIRIAGARRTAKEIEQRTYTSADGGKTWQPMDLDRPADQRIFDVGQTGKYLISSQQAGIFRSSNQGKTWELVCPSNADDKPIRFKLAVSGQAIFAVRAFSGC